MMLVMLEMNLILLQFIQFEQRNCIMKSSTTERGQGFLGWQLPNGGPLC